VDNDTQITVRCTSASWPNVYTVILQATAGDARCPDADSKTANVNRYNKPDLTVEGPSDTSVCVDALCKEFPFILRTNATSTIKITALTSATPSGKRMDCQITSPDSSPVFPYTGEC
jgi:hypothetical protein